MLIHTASGATATGKFLVVYQTPGCNIRTVARICTTQAQADGEAARLNAEQASTEHALHIERMRCGLVAALEADHGR